MNRRILVIVIALVIALAAGYFVIVAESGDYSKILVLTLRVSDGGVTPLSEEVRYGHAPATGLAAGTWQGRLLDADGKTVRQFTVWDPRVQLGDSVAENGSIRGATTVSQNADLLLVLPYTGKEEHFVLSDTTTGKKLSDVSLAGAAAAFNSTYPDDPDLVAVAGERKIPGVSLPVLAGGCILAVLLIIVAIMMVRGK